MSASGDATHIVEIPRRADNLQSNTGTQHRSSQERDLLSQIQVGSWATGTKQHGRNANTRIEPTPRSSRWVISFWNNNKFVRHHVHIEWFDFVEYSPGTRYFFISNVWVCIDLVLRCTETIRSRTRKGTREKSWGGEKQRKVGGTKFQKCANNRDTTIWSETANLCQGN